MGHQRRRLGACRAPRSEGPTAGVEPLVQLARLGGLSPSPATPLAAKKTLPKCSVVRSMPRALDSAETSSSVKYFL